MCVVLAYLSRVTAVQSLHDALPRSGWTDQHAQLLWQAGDTEIVFLLSLISQIHAAGLVKPRLLRGARNVFRRVLETKAKIPILLDKWNDCNNENTIVVAEPAFCAFLRARPRSKPSFLVTRRHSGLFRANRGYVMTIPIYRVFYAETGPL